MQLTDNEGVMPCNMFPSTPSEEGMNAGLGSSVPPASQSYRLLSPGECLEYVPDPSTILLGDSIIEKGQWTSLVGVGGIGKSRIVLWLCLCLITGREWCGLPVSKTCGKIIFFGSENGLNRWYNDFSKYHQYALSEDEWSSVDQNLKILDPRNGNGGLYLEGEACQGRLRETLRQEQPQLIIFDPFANMVVGDENKNADVLLTLRTLRTIIDQVVPDAAVLIIHHAGTGWKNVLQAGDNYNQGNMGRGAKALYSSVRAEIQLVAGDRNDPSKLVLACGKANNGQKFKTRGIVFDSKNFVYSVDPDFNEEAWRKDVAGRRHEQRVSIVNVVSVVKNFCPKPEDSADTKDIIAQVKADFGGSGITIKRRLAEAVKTGYLQQPKRGRYSLGKNSQ